METNNTPTARAWNLNKPGYFGFLLIGIVYLVKKDSGQAVIYFGLALVFDPFDIKVPFTKRPVYQQIWLIVHLAITLSLLVLDFVK